MSPRRLALFLLLFLAAVRSPAAQTDAVAPWLDARIDDLTALYRHLHEHPELSFRETATAARMAAELRAAGLTVTEQVGGTGVVGVLDNGAGPVGLLRADMDALPIAEATGLPYASKIRAESADGRAIGVMHACGHDVHMACLVGAAAWLAAHRDAWRGTLVFVCQPAEERAGGMKAMLADGLLTRFPRPAWALALHTADDLPVGTIGVRSGPAMANVDSCDITMFGRGGHGARPHLTIDPIVQAAQLVMELQTIVAREIDPVQAAVITVGSIHGGSKHNIVGDRCHLQLTVRSYDAAVRDHMLAAIERKAKAVAASCRAPAPTVEFSEHTPLLANDRALTDGVRAAAIAEFGAEHVVEIAPAMVAEDFGRLTAQGVPLCMFRLGTIASERLARLRAAGALPPLHSAEYHPDAESAIRAGIRAYVAIVGELAKRE
ncbi:MAG: amidohydrolase [Planctomycetes bacterium]|nr:amidohydrolase [Planctomycetota bacterium]